MDHLFYIQEGEILNQLIILMSLWLVQNQYYQIKEHLTNKRFMQFELINFSLFPVKSVCAPDFDLNSFAFLLLVSTLVCQIPLLVSSIHLVKGLSA